MATTLANLRAKLNGELNVTDDTGDTVWSPAVRNNAISDGYAALWRVGVWKPVTQDLASVADQWVYALTSIRSLQRLEVLESTGWVDEIARGRVEADGAGGWQLRLASPIDTGFTIRVRGWAPYKSTFSGEGDPDDLDAEYNRIPLLKAKAILYRMIQAQFARYGFRQSLPPEMNVTPETLFATIAAAEREFTDEAKSLAALRPRPGQIRSLGV